MSTIIVGNAYSGSVTTTTEEFVFSAEKQDLRISNNGAALLELIIDGEITPIEGGKSYSHDGYITTFRMRSKSGTGYYNLTCGDSVKAAIANLGGGGDTSDLREDINALANPVSATFTITTPASAVEVGAKVTSIVFSWNITNWASVANNGAKIYDIAAGTYIHTIAEASGTHTIAVDLTKTEPGTQTYRLDIVDDVDKTVSISKTVNWYWAIYTGGSASTSLDEAGVEGLTKALKSGFAGTYAIAAGATYKYVCYPSALGTASGFKDSGTNLDVPMEAATTVTVTNANGTATSYRVHRTTNIINAAISIIVA